MFELKIESYEESVRRLPVSGQQIIGCVNADSIVVYQAYRKEIADFAVKNQYLGGPHFSYSRMSWIKPNFLWMMFRCGWAEKENQEAVLAMKISKKFFIEILNNAAMSSFNSDFHQDRDKWKDDLKLKEVRLQWDPDHNPFGEPITRRAIQLGLKGNILQRFGKEQVLGITDITPFVKEQKKMLDEGRIDELLVPFESILDLDDVKLRNQVGVKIS